MTQLSDALFTTTQQHVLALLYGKPEKSFYLKEILRMTGMGVATIKRELSRMTAAGILTLQKIGNQHHYQANPACPIYMELLGIVRKSIGLVAVLQSALLPMDEVLNLAFVYGSIAKGSEHAESDIDLMLIGEDLAYGEVMALLIPAEEALGRPINPTLYTPSGFKDKLAQQNHFLERVMEQPKIMVKGVTDDIGKFIQH